MVGMPYLLLGTIGFLVYRGLKKNAAWRENLGAEGLADPQGDPSCPTSPEDDSYKAP